MGGKQPTMSVAHEMKKESGVQQRTEIFLFNVKL